MTGIYTNAVYGFLSILFKELEEVNPKYLAVAFDLKAPTHRHKLYEGYKANRKGMPNELASQMPILKDVLHAMNIKIVEKEGFEADDLLGSYAKWGQSVGLEAIILTGDRDSFQLIDSNINVRIPRTKMGKTETEDYSIAKIKEEYNLEPKDLIELKGLMGDSSDNIPGVPGVGPKTANDLIVKYKTIEEVYNHIDELKGKLKENLMANKELAILSRTLGIIDINVDIEKDLNVLEIKEWDNEKVYELFKKLKFSRFIERFNLTGSNETKENNFVINYKEEYNLEALKENIIKQERLFYYILTKEDNEKILNKKISEIAVYIEQNDTSYIIKEWEALKEIFEDENILKVRL